MSQLLAVGISHKTAPVGLRERLSLSEQEATGFAWEMLTGRGTVTEAVTFATCNRTEIHVAASDPVAAEAELLSALSKQAGISATELAGSIYTARNCDAARHLFRVAAGLESMVLGEDEIQGQVRRAYEDSLAAGHTGPLLNRLFRAAIETGKRVRHETGLGGASMSVPAVAVELARERIGDLEGRRVVILGTGEMAELTAQALAGRGAEVVFLANRRHHRALDLARRLGGTVARLEELPSELPGADVLISATASPHPIVGADELREILRDRGERDSLVAIDIAVPRDIEAACAELEQVALYDIDDLEAVVDRNRVEQMDETRGASEIVESEIQRFAQWLGQLEVTPTIAALRQRGDEIADSVVDENSGRWEDISERDLERIELIAHTVAKRVLHMPTVRLKQIDSDKRHSAIHMLGELFDIDATGGEGEPSGEGHAEVRELPQGRNRGRS